LRPEGVLKSNKTDDIFLLLEFYPPLERKYMPFQKKERKFMLMIPTYTMSGKKVPGKPCELVLADVDLILGFQSS
jgi:hypothetical protein